MFNDRGVYGKSHPATHTLGNKIQGIHIKLQILIPVQFIEKVK